MNRYVNYSVYTDQNDYEFIVQKCTDTDPAEYMITIRHFGEDVVSTDLTVKEFNALTKAFNATKRES